MTKLQSLWTFIRAEDGATTVDWVVLTAATVTLAVTAVAMVNTGTTNLTSKMLTGITVKQVK